MSKTQISSISFKFNSFFLTRLRLYTQKHASVTSNEEQSVLKNVFLAQPEKKIVSIGVGELELELSIVSTSGIVNVVE